MTKPKQNPSLKDPLARYLGLSLVLSRKGVLGIPETQAIANGCEYVASYLEQGDEPIVRIHMRSGGTESVMHQIRKEQLAAKADELRRRAEALERDLDTGKRGFALNETMANDRSLPDAERKRYADANQGASEQFRQRQTELDSVRARLQATEAELEAHCAVTVAPRVSEVTFTEQELLGAWA